MTDRDYRLVAAENLVAKRATRALHVPKASNDAAKQGLRYERRVRTQLLRHVANGHFDKLEHNPWFTFSDVFGDSSCCPDFLLWRPEGGIVIVDAKLTWVPHALSKIVELYMPVIATALRARVSPLVVVRNLTPETPQVRHTIREAMEYPVGVLQWFDNGPMIW